MKIVKEAFITLLGALAIIALLKFTGLLGDFTYITQSTALKTGLMDASTSAKKPVDFDFNFKVKDLNEAKYSFDQFKGKVIFLNLWATWCGPCKAEMPGIQELYNSLPADSVVFVMLSLDKEGLQPKVKKYIADKKFTFPVYMPSGFLTEQLNVPSIPTTFIINKEGKIVSKEVGTTNFNTTKFKKFLLDLTK
ncbi:MAG: TlpA family protein disulfide reductase [Cyclobacteriaceae bacterium]|nr:TlpA family protein disulfide reductase [Cyclobacteriaceae bacterium]